MKQFSINFNGWCLINAENIEDAKTKFWDFIKDGEPPIQCWYEIECIEEETDE